MRTFKRSAVSVLFLLVVTVSGLWAVDPALVIYHIGVGHGDCALIIARDVCKRGNKQQVYTVLVDPGPGNRNPDFRISPAGLLAEIERILQRYGVNRLDMIVISHFHEDHFGSAYLMLRTIIDNANSTDPPTRDKYDAWLKGLTIVDRRVYDNTDPNYPEFGVPDGPVFTEYNGLMDSRLTRYPVVKVGNDLFNGDYFTTCTSGFKNIHMWCLAADGYCNGGQQLTQRRENALSYAFLIEYNGFRYYTGGDLDGDNTSPYVDMETQLIGELAGRPGAPFHVCAMKVNHHGSDHSTRLSFAQALNPTVAVITAGLRTFGDEDTDPLPRETPINRLRGVQAHLYYTYIPEGVRILQSGDRPGDGNRAYYTVPPGTSDSKISALQDVAIIVPVRANAGLTVRFTVDRFRRDIDSFVVDFATRVTRPEECVAEKQH